MSNVIIAKLREHLNKPINTESAAVYLLTQIRKLLESGQANGSNAVTMFCNWTVHGDLERTTTHEFLSRVDEFVLNKVDPFRSTPSWNLLEEERLNKDLLSLDNFRAGLRDVLQRLDLPATLVDEDQAWAAFVDAYGGVIGGGRLTVKSQKIQLRVVEKVIFAKGTGPGPFTVRWTVCLRDGRALIIELGADGPVRLGSFSLVSAAEAGC